MITSLPMYPIFSGEVEAFWAAIAIRLLDGGMADVPDTLTWPDLMLEHMRRPDLLLSQTCGYPMMKSLAGTVRVIGAFRYTARGCDGIRYCSTVIARANDPATDIAGFRGRRAAYNGSDSQSGYNTFRALVAPLAIDGRFFGETIETGAHRASMQAVADGRADVATIDCVSFAQVCAVDPDLSRSLKVIGETPSAPGLPLITHGTATDANVALLRGAVGDVVRAPELAAIRARLMIDGFEPIELDAYDEIIAMERAAIAAGYPTLS